jgi:serine/threonine-protein kinase RsbW
LIRPLSQRKLSSMPAETLLRLQNDFSELPATAEKVAEFLESQGASPDIIFAADLAIEEIVTNIIKYGYDDSGSHEILVRLSLPNGELKLEIEDGGHEFDPFDRPAPNIHASIEEREIGGLGIHFVKNLLDSCEYRRAGDRNIVTLTKKPKSP